MKKLYIAIFIGLLASTSCEDFLEEEPKDEMSSGQFFSEPSHAYNAVNSLYRNGAPQMYGTGTYQGSRAMLGNYMTGYFDNEYKGQEPHVQNAQQLTISANNLSDYLGGIWGDLYRGISRANNAIKYIPTTPGLSEEEAGQLTAEARFFRAFAYYHLVRMFGEVPLITEPYESLENLYVERNTIKEIYDLIVEDLQYAAAEGRLPETSMASNENRVSRGTAATLLSEVYLTMSGYPLQENHYEDAANAARIVINSGNYSLTQHDVDSEGNVIPENSAYNKIRKSDASANEYIYFLEYAVGIAQTSYPAITYPVALASDVAYSITNGAYQPANGFLWGYNPEEDLRVQNKQYYHTTFEAEDGTIKTFPPTPYIWHDDQAVFETASSGKDLAVYTYSDVLLIAAEAIARSQGVTSEAAGYLARVRSRAYWKKDIAEIESELMALSVDEFVEEVWEERYRELVFEFSLWHDIQRTRKFPVTSENGMGEINFVDVLGYSNKWGQTIQEKNLLFPIPETEIQRNPSLLPQNPGYD
ncbi:RagB/SusD family nutrient uptake outer membrane protein [Cesiribacter sp. SM1]|uniref:RagB/SusD family nutrient uptake outer membrane protein n=1 Tax=Cesiribacter sp. SM1 TaxID=2861196 RepID=UPI001CD4D073|nr:RagB/SusD family nutrient uptake outer membrane protein [Cesiribacter sp. SM1]